MCNAAPCRAALKCRQLARQGSDAWKRNREHEAELEEQRIERLRELVVAQREIDAAFLGIDVSEKDLLAVLPANARRLAPLTVERREKFRQHLRDTVALTFRQLRRVSCKSGAAAAVRTESDGISSEADSFFTSCCASCAGHCCMEGGEKAYLFPKTFLAFIRKHPTVKPRDVVKIYFEQLSDTTYEHSCVYHGAHGCSLKRELRSSVCNGYLCSSVRSVLASLRLLGNSEKVYVAAIDQQKEKILRSQFVTAGASNKLCS